MTAVDLYMNGPNADPVFGPSFSFFTDNAAPEIVIDMEDPTPTWIPNGYVDVDLTATVTDDGLVEPVTQTWLVVSEPDDPNSPDAVIADPGAEDTVVSLSALGEYVLRLEAYDGEYFMSETVTINVYADSCEAAKSVPGFELIPGDLNEDCVINDLDLAILEANWLKCNALDCSGLVDPNAVGG